MSEQTIHTPVDDKLEKPFGAIPVPETKPHEWYHPEPVKEVADSVRASVVPPVTPASLSQAKESAKDVVSQVKESVSQSKEVRVAKTYGEIIKSNPLYSDASKLLHWRDPVKTGLLFGIFNFFFFLSTWADYSILTIVSYLLLTLLTICFGYSNYVVLKAQWVQGKHVENPFTERFKDVKFHVSRESAEKHFNTILDLINVTIDNFRDVFYCTDNLLSLRFALYFYLGAVVGNWFSGPTILYLAMLAFFTWPRLYEEKQKEIDHFYGIAKVEASKYYNLALSKLPPVVTDKIKALKPKTN